MTQLSGPTPRTMRLRNGVRTIGIAAGGQFITEPTYGEYVLLEDYQNLELMLAEAVGALEAMGCRSGGNFECKVGRVKINSCKCIVCAALSRIKAATGESK